MNSSFNYELLGRITDFALAYRHSDLSAHDKTNPAHVVVLHIQRKMAIGKQCRVEWNAHKPDKEFAAACRDAALLIAGEQFVRDYLREQLSEDEVFHGLS